MGICDIIPTFKGEIMNISQEYLKEVFIYKDGVLFWNVDKRKMKIGEKAGRTKKNGYCEIRLNGKLYGTHRLIFLMFHGYLPKIIDHIDGNPSNNLISNLRSATHAENMRNSKKPINNKSGFKGVYFNKETKKWIAQCVVNNKKHHIGSYEDIHEAANAIMSFRNKNHKNFAKHN